MRKSYPIGVLCVKLQAYIYYDCDKIYKPPRNGNSHWFPILENFISEICATAKSRILTKAIDLVYFVNYSMGYLPNKIRWMEFPWWWEWMHHQKHWFKITINSKKYVSIISLFIFEWMYHQKHWFKITINSKKYVSIISLFIFEWMHHQKHCFKITINSKKCV